MIAWRDSPASHHHPGGELVARLRRFLGRPAAQAARQVSRAERISRAAGVDRLQGSMRRGDTSLGEPAAPRAELDDDLAAARPAPGGGDGRRLDLVAGDLLFVLEGGEAEIGLSGRLASEISE
jgi:hypothetical protein